MTTHERARELASAAHDGELDPALRPELDAHLAGCESCRGFATGTALLAEAVARSPRLRAPAGMPERVRARIRPRRRWAWSLAPVATAAAVLALVIVAGGTGGGVFQLPPAGAAEPLTTLTTLYVEREVVTPYEGRFTERVWFLAPGFVRIERSTGELIVRRPDRVFSSRDGAMHAIPPAIALPEPLSPAVALLGTDAGPGPDVAGRPTRRVELAIGGERRTALVDAQQRSLVGSDQTIVLVKGGGDGTVTKRVTRVEIDRPIDLALFELPAGPSTDAGFRETTDLAIEPRALPRGFELLRGGTGPEGDALLYARGALPLLVTAGPSSPADGNPKRTEAVTVGGRPAVLVLSLYEPPLVRFAMADRVVSVSAPLPPETLVQTATAMFPAE